MATPTINDYFLKVGQPGTATTLSAPGYTAGGNTINVASTGSFPTDTAVIFAIDTVGTSTGSQVENTGSYCVFVGIVTSATSIGSLSLLYGTPQNYAAAATTRVFITVSSQHTNRLITGLLQQHNQDGSHGNVTATSITTPTLTVSTTVNLPAASVPGSKLTNSSVTPDKLATGATSSTLVATGETTASHTYVDLTTVTDTVTTTIGANGIALVNVYASMSNNAANSISFVGFAVSGATTIAATDSMSMQFQAYAANSLSQIGSIFLATGLTPGSNTFKMKYRADSNTSTFANRRITVVPL